MATMTALVWRPDRGLALDRQVEMPAVKEDQVLIRVRSCGICGTDLHILEKAFGFDPAHIMGHEIVGEVVATGQRVFVAPFSECGACRGCRAGKPHFCVNSWCGSSLGIVRNGGWAQFVAAPKRSVLPLPDDLPLEIAVLTEPMACVERGLNRLGRVRPHQRIVVFGAGLIGLLFLLTLHRGGATNLIIVEVDKRRRELANNIAIPVTVWDVVQFQASEDKFDIIVDCTGSPKALESGLIKLERGGTYLVFGCSPKGETAGVDLCEVVLNEWKILGSRMNPYTNIDAIAMVRDLYQNGLLSLDKLQIKSFSLDEYKDAFKALREAKVSKAVFEI